MGKIIKCKYIGMQSSITSGGNKVRVAVCDDIMPAAEYYGDLVESILRQLEVEGEVVRYTKAEELLSCQTGYDMIFLDIEMPDHNGLETADELRKKRLHGKIIFMTNYDTYIQEAYKVQPFRYLYKSDPKEWIREAITSALKENEERQGILLEIDGQIHRVVLDDILYIEALGDEVAIIIGEEEKYIVKMTLKAIYGLLGNRFVKCSRGVAVNPRHTLAVRDASIILDSGLEISISYRERKNVKQKYQEYIKKSVNW